MTTTKLHYLLGLLGSTAIVGCADPCFDDGLLQEQGEADNCAALASDTDSGTDSNTAPTATMTATDSAGGGCSNGVQDGDETDVDCGGSCDAGCGDGQGCGGNEDCASAVCDVDAMECVGEGSCTDGVQNQDETDLDCGGVCGATCETGEMCDDGGDCISDSCGADGTCDPPTGGACGDGEQNQDETDVDCGGVCGSTCEIGEGCKIDEDCVSDNCEDDGTCQVNLFWCPDADGDGFGDPEGCVEVPEGMDPPAGSVNNDNDCDDTSAFTFPGAAPNDSLTACMEDKDGDDWGDDEPSGPATTPGTDCDDDSESAATTFPGAAPNDDAEACMNDEDDDDYGDDDPPDGVTPGSDCEDGDAAIPPGCDDDGLTVDATANPINITLGQTSSLLATAMGGDGNYTYGWAPGGTLDNTMMPGPTATPAQSTTYAVTVMDGAGAMATDNATVHVTDEPLDLSECEPVDLGIDLDNNPTPIWEYTNGGTQACETANGDPTALVCNVELDDATFNAHFEVQDNDDNDHIGFVWGYQDSTHFYVLTWKQEGQTFTDCNVDVPTGVVIKVIDAMGGLNCEDLLDDTDTPNSTVLATPDDFLDQGWEDNREYLFELDHFVGGFTARIIRESNGNVVGEQTIMDTTYDTGRFGVYSYSQASSCFWDVFTAGN